MVRHALSPGTRCVQLHKVQNARMNPSARLDVPALRPYLGLRYSIGRGGMSYVLGCLLFGLLPAGIAYWKGLNFLAWWIFGASLFLALPLVIIAQTDQEGLDRRAVSSGSSKKCPYCAEIVKVDANVCKHCGRDLTSKYDATAKVQAIDIKIDEVSL